MRPKIPPNGNLSTHDYRTNVMISTERVIVENFRENLQSEDYHRVTGGPKDFMIRFSSSVYVSRMLISCGTHFGVRMAFNTAGINLLLLVSSPMWRSMALYFHTSEHGFLVSHRNSVKRPFSFIL